MKRNQFNEEQLKVINNTFPMETLYETLLEISNNKDYNLQRKRFLMFRELVNYMRVRKGDFLLVGIKSNLADKLVKNEIHALEKATKELKDVIS